MARRTQDFRTIRSEGGLLPQDLLRRVLDPHSGLPGTTADDYHLSPGERLNEVITQSWNRLHKNWGNYSGSVAGMKQGGIMGRPSKTDLRASSTLPPFLRIVER